MLDFDKHDLETLERLCRIKCRPEEEGPILNSLSKILNYIEQLEEVDTKGVSPCSFILKEMHRNVFREDEISEIMPRDTFLENAPDHIGGMIKVFPVIKF